MFVVDLDSDEACWAWIGLCERRGNYDPTLTIKTGRARHIYFKSASKIKNSTSQIAEGIDVRAHGGYVIAPPSVHPSGAVYALENRDALQVAEAPKWLVDLALPKEPPVSAFPPTVPARIARKSDFSEAYLLTAVEGEMHAVMHAPVGYRNDTLHKAAVRLGTLYGAGALSFIGTEKALLAAAQEAGLPLDEARRTIASGLDFRAQHPRMAPALVRS